MASGDGNLGFREVQTVFLVNTGDIMKILIDARMYGLEHAGIGRYVMNLVGQLKLVDTANEHVVLVNNSQIEKLEIGKSMENGKWKMEIIKPDCPHYSFQEQIRLPQILNNLDFDLAHFPHFNVPFFFKRPFVVTIHDLIKHTSRGSATTTRAPFLYWLKYTGYKMVFSNAVHKARKIIVPSQAVKEELLKEYGLDEERVTVIYEGIDDSFKSPITPPKARLAKGGNHQSQKILNKYSLINKLYVIYTGSAYPHKNLERLISAVKQLHINLVIVSARNVFTARLIQYVNKIKADSFVNFLGFVPDDELALLYKNAKAFVFPSLSEGFGLPGLEAMAAGCPVVCSDIPVFHEIYGDAATYFNPYNVGDIAQKIGEVLRLDDSKHRRMVEKGEKRAQQFSWQNMAKETLRVYNSV